jgi:hypothetical protein
MENFVIHGSGLWRAKVVAKIGQIRGILARNPGGMKIDPVSIVAQISLVKWMLGYNGGDGPLTPTKQGIFQYMDFVPLIALQKSVEGLGAPFHQDRMEAGF